MQTQLSIVILIIPIYHLENVTNFAVQSQIKIGIIKNIDQPKNINENKHLNRCENSYYAK